MLLTLHKIARRLVWCRFLALVLAAVGITGTVASLFAGKGNLSSLLEPSLVLTLWGMMLFAFIQLFRRIPPPVLPHDSFMTKLGTRIVLAGYTLLAFLVVIVTCTLFWMSLKLISVQ